LKVSTRTDGEGIKCLHLRICAVPGGRGAKYLGSDTGISKEMSNNEIMPTAER